MRIGILTFHRALNYGAILQCYALSETLKGQGYDVEIIDYRPSYIEKYRKLFYWNDFKRLSLLSKIKNMCLLPLTYISKRKTTKLFDSFLDKHFSFSPVVKDSKDIQNNYDVIVFGSDQIWNPNICCGLDPIYYGQIPKGKTKFVSYAASIGTPQNIPNTYRDLIKLYMEQFDSISVRESKTIDFLYNGKKEIELVLDPTLLASKNVFEKIAKKPTESKYVLLYMLEDDNRAISFAQRIAHQLNCKLYRLQAIYSFHKPKKGYAELSSKSITEFLGYFKYAEFVVNVSFHGTAFSIIFEKNFYTLQSKNFERSRSILMQLSLTDRFVFSSDDINVKPIDYEMVNDKLKQIRENSMNYLIGSIQ